MEISYGDHYRSLNDYDILIENTADGLSIKAELLERDRRSSLHFAIKAPRELVLDFFTAGGGLELNGVVGDFSGKTAGGPLQLKDVNGHVDLKTGGGSIEVLDSVLNGRVRTGGGTVLVQNVTGDLKANSGGGNVSYVNVRSASGELRGPEHLDIEDASEDSVLISSQGGRINVSSALDGASVYTGGGGIRVRGADRFVSARTGGGDIEIETLQGWIDASTGAGQIEVTVEKNAHGKGDIKLISGAGNIILTLPDDFSMVLDIELGITNNAKRDFEIRSDFDLDIQSTDKWDYSKGTPRKHIYGSITLGSGDHSVKIRTTNGNVEIRSLGNR